MRRLFSYSLSALFILSGCGAKPTPEKKQEAVSAKPTEEPKKKDEAPAKDNKKPAAKKPKEKKAAPKEDKKLASTDRQAYYKALNEARTAHRAKDYKAAISSFDKALALFPDDPRALSEKGWAEFFDKDLAAAASDTNNAIGRTTDTELLGSSYYNLGRIQEEQKKIAEATKSYQESLKVRPGNKIVKARLEQLNASLVEKGALEGPYLDLKGPFATLPDVCKELSKNDDSSAKVLCDAEAKEPFEGEQTIAGSGSYLAAKLIATQTGYMGEGETEPYYYPEASYHIAVQTAEGWFILPDVQSIYNPGAFGISAELSVSTFEFKDVIPGGEPELIYVATNQLHDSDMGINEEESRESSILVICGAGPSKKMSCANVAIKENAERGILFEDEEKTFKEENPDFKHEGLYKRAWSLDWSFSPDGKLQLKGTPNKDMSEDTKKLIGAHTLSFL